MFRDEYGNSQIVTFPAPLKQPPPPLLRSLPLSIPLDWHATEIVFHLCFVFFPRSKGARVTIRGQR